MTLDPMSVEPLVEAWSRGRAIAWTAHEKIAVATALQTLSDQVTPHVVIDDAGAAMRVQEILVDRAIDALEAWLCRAAAALRHSLGVQAPRMVPGGTALALGLRSASHAELEALPGVGEELAAEIGRHLALHPGRVEVDELLAVDGIGPQRLELLRRYAYVDQPRVRLVSPSLWSFALDPGIDTFLEVLENTDLAFSYGDHTAIVRRLPTMGGSVAQRLTHMIEVVTEQLERRAAMVDGVVASAAMRRLERHDKRATLLGASTSVRGQLLVDAHYVAAVEDVIDGARTRVSLMVFLGTAAAGIPGHPGPLVLIDALEAAVARGVTVRVILDQDDGGEPYGSYWINRPLLQRLRQSGIEVRFDREDVLMHSKVLVVDGRTAVVGSHNWTRTGFNDAHELSVLLEGEAVAASFEARFAALWAQLPA